MPSEKEHKVFLTLLRAGLWEKETDSLFPVVPLDSLVHCFAVDSSPASLWDNLCLSSFGGIELPYLFSHVLSTRTLVEKTIKMLC